MIWSDLQNGNINVEYKINSKNAWAESDGQWVLIWKSWWHFRWHVRVRSEEPRYWLLKFLNSRLLENLGMLIDTIKQKKKNLMMQKREVLTKGINTTDWCPLWPQCNHHLLETESVVSTIFIKIQCYHDLKIKMWGTQGAEAECKVQGWQNT